MKVKNARLCPILQSTALWIIDDCWQSYATAGTCASSASINTLRPGRPRRERLNSCVYPYTVVIIQPLAVSVLDTAFRIEDTTSALFRAIGIMRMLTWAGVPAPKKSVCPMLIEVRALSDFRRSYQHQ